MVDNNLPPNWSWVNLGEVLKVSSGKGLTSDKMLSGGKYPVYGGNGVTGYYNEFLFEESKLIIGRVGAKCGVVHITKNKSWVTDNALVVDLITDRAEVRFLYHCLTYHNLNKLSVSTAQPVISGAKIYPYEISLPPINLQSKIVEKMEELFSDLENGVASLKKAKEQIKHYRQSVLNSAFNGKLSAGHPELVSGSNGLPKGWKLVKLSEIAQVKGGKRLPKGESYSETQTKHPYIRVVDFENMSIRTVGLKYLKQETRDKIKNYFIRKEDLYISIAGTIGRVGMIPEKLDGANLTENAAKITEIENYNLRFLSYLMNSSLVQNQIKTLTISTTQPKLALFRIQKLEMPQPPINQQTKIVEEIEKRFSKTNNLEKAIDESLTKSDALRQSILKQAFEGKLV